MMIQYIREAFKERINELGDDWLDDVSRRRSLDKVDAITQMVAYPDNIMDNDYVNGISESVSCTLQSSIKQLFQPSLYIYTCLSRSVSYTVYPIAGPLLFSTYNLHKCFRV